MAIDLGNDPGGTPPTAGEKLQIRSAIGVGTTDAPTFLAQTLTGQSLTGTQATSLVDLSATWNTTGTPSALKLNVTDTASNANSLLMDLQVGGVSKLKVDKTGVITPINVYAGGSLGYALFNDVGLGLRSAAVIGWTAGNALNAQDTILARDAAGVIAQRNGANAQMFRVYNTYTDASNYERLHIGYSSGAAAFQILSDALGTGAPKQLVIGTNTNASLVLMTGSLSKWYVNSAGHFLAATHNAYDIGATGGVSCPRNIFAAGTVHATGFSVAFQSNIAGTGVALYDGNTGTSIKTNAGAGIILLGNAIASTDFGRLQLGGTTSAFPAIRRNGTGIDIRLADDSAYSHFTASALVTGNGIGGGNGVTFLSQTRIMSASDGVMFVSNFALNDFNRLQLGGTTSAFPAIKRNGTGIDIRLADDSAFAPISSLYQRFGSGTPEGAVTAPTGAVFHRTDGGSGSSFYVKESGSGPNGWVGK